MSGFLATLGWNRPLFDDNVAIVIGDTRLEGWQSVNIVRSCEGFPNAFTMTASEAFPFDPTRIIADPGKGEVCKIYIGGDLVITGYIDRYTILTAGGQHDVQIMGRGLCQDVTDCSADIINNPAMTGAVINASDILDLAAKLVAPLKVKLVGDDKGRAFPGFQVAPGETAYEVIEKVARYAGFLIYEDATGAVVLDRVGTHKMASGFQMPGNIEAAQSILSIDQRFSDYIVVFQSVQQYQDISDGWMVRAHERDDKVPRKRLRIIVSEQYQQEYDIATARAKWEKARRIGRSQAIQLTCDSWRDSDGKLWQPNALVPIDAVAHKIVDLTWLIGTVSFRKDLSGTHADLTLMPPDAFNPEPEALNVWDRQIEESPPASQDPAPPSTSDVRKTTPGGE